MTLLIRTLGPAQDNVLLIPKHNSLRNNKRKAGESLNSEALNAGAMSLLFLFLVTVTLVEGLEEVKIEQGVLRGEELT